LVGTNEVKERVCYHRKALDEPLVEVDKSRKSLDICPVLGNRPFMDSIHLDGVHRDFIFQDNKFQVFDLLLLELAFLRVQKQLVFGQNLQHSPDSSYILLYRPGKDKDVIQIDYHYILGNEILENIVHHYLEGGWTVGHPKEHHKRLK